MTEPRFYTTTIAAHRSCQEIGELVRKYGAKRFAIDFDRDGEPTAVMFMTEVPGFPTALPVRLEAQIAGIERRLTNRKTRNQPEKIKARALRIAWRQVKAHVEITLELVENGVRPFHEAFFADLVGEGGIRLADYFMEHPDRLLPPASDNELLLGG